MLKVEGDFDQILVAKAFEAEQGHVFAFWEGLGEAERHQLLGQLAQVDFQLLGKLVELIDAEPTDQAVEIAPLPIERADGERRALLAGLGWQAIQAGQVACVAVAGGQGTRLGWDGPKGTHPAGPVSGKSLFQLFAEQLLAMSKRVERAIPWYVLTSNENRTSTEEYFAKHENFGLAEGQVRFLVQRELPNTDSRGLLLMADRAQIAMSPNGHGGTLEALNSSGALEAMQAEGIEHLFYFQVDNPLCRVADPVFLGAHIEGQAEVSTKVVRKEDPSEKIGLVVLKDGRAGVVEYSEMSEEQQVARDASGLLEFRGGNTAIHIFSLAFLARLLRDGFDLAHHVARKKVPYLDSSGNRIEPETPNACKFETFIFDLLPKAERHLALEVERSEEFEPLKNKTGPYSPETVRRAQSERALKWLREAGVNVAGVEFCEISPLTALGPAELKAKVPALTLDVHDGKLTL